MPDRVVPARGEVIQLDTIDAPRRDDAAEHAVARRVGHDPRAVARVVARRPTATPLAGADVEVAVLPDIALVPEFAAAAEQILSESKL